MTKKRLSKAVDRSFRLAGNALMRHAIARLIHVDDNSLSKSGLSRAAIDDFLATPLRTDPHRFFKHRHIQDQAAQDADAPIKDLNGPGRDVDDRATNTPQVGSVAPQPPITRVVKATTALRLRVLTAGALIGFGALTACSGTKLEPDTAVTRREQPAHCRLKPTGQLISGHAAGLQDLVTARSGVITDAPRLQQQHDARDGPAK